MVVRILYFAALRDLVGLAEESVDLPEHVRTVSALRDYLGESRAPLAGSLDKIRIARNEAFAGPDDGLEVGDVLALIPPVAGG